MPKRPTRPKQPTSLKKSTSEIAQKAETPRTAKRASRSRLVILLLTLGVLVPVLWFSGMLAATPRSWSQKAISRSRLDEATYWLRWAQRLSFRDAENALLAARIARHAGDPIELKSQLARARSLGADTESVEREQALALAQVGQLDDVESKIGTWLTSFNGDAAEISDAYANGLAATARFDEAMQVLKAWRSDFPQDPRCDFRIGRLEEHVERYEDAEKSYKRSIAIDGEFFPASFSLARVMLHQRRVEEALEHFGTCMEMANPLAAKVETAVALKSLGRADEGRKLLEEVLEHSETEIEASYRAVEEQPEGFRAAAEYGRLESDAGNFQEALPWLQAAIRENPLDLTVRYSLGVTLRGLGRMDEAEREFEQVRQARDRMGAANALNVRIKANPEDLEARLGLGKLILENESERMGLYWIRSIFSFDPNHEDAHRTLANYYASIMKRDPKFASLARHHRQLADGAAAVRAANEN